MANFVSFYTHPPNTIILKNILCIILFKYVSLKDKDSLKNIHHTII